jgi:hypothetical protein
MARGLTIEGAYDDILGLFKAAWSVNAPPLNGGAAPPVEWPNVPVGDPQLSAGNTPWARVTVQHHLRSQHAMGGPAGSVYTATGTVTIQIFVPLAKRGLVDLARLSKVAVDAYEGKRTPEVWFRNVNYREVGEHGGWFQANVTADFSYDVVK